MLILTLQPGGPGLDRPPPGLRLLDQADYEKAVRAALLDLPARFLNRLDEVICFTP